MYKRNFHSYLHTLHLHIGAGHVLMNFLNSIIEVVDLIYSRKVFHMCAPKVLRLLKLQTLSYFEYGWLDYAFYE